MLPRVRDRGKRERTEDSMSEPHFLPCPPKTEQDMASISRFPLALSHSPEYRERSCPATLPSSEREVDMPMSESVLNWLLGMPLGSMQSITAGKGKFLKYYISQHVPGPTGLMG